MLDAKLYCVFFLIFYILYEKKLLYFALLWTASHGAFLNLFLCQFTLFCRICFWTKGNTHFSVRYRWHVYLAHAFGIRCTLIDEYQKRSCIHEVLSLTVSVCAGAYLSCFCCFHFGLIYLSLFVTVLKSAHLWYYCEYEGLFKGHHTFWRLHQLIRLTSIVFTLCHLQSLK